MKAIGETMKPLLKEERWKWLKTLRRDELAALGLSAEERVEFKCPLKDPWDETTKALARLQKYYNEVLEPAQPEGRPKLAQIAQEETATRPAIPAKEGKPASPEWLAWNDQVTEQFRKPCQKLGAERSAMLISSVDPASQ